MSRVVSAPPNVSARRGRTCTVCSHKAIDVIDRQLVSGTSLRNIAEQFQLAVSSLHRHKAWSRARGFGEGP